MAPEGPLADAYGPLELWTLKSRIAAHAECDTHWYLPPISRLSAYYSDYFNSLKAAGIDFVKVDDQAHQDYTFSREGAGGDAGKLRTEMLSAMRSASDQVFRPGTSIHCMVSGITSLCIAHKADPTSNRPARQGSGEGSSDWSTKG